MNHNNDNKSQKNNASTRKEIGLELRKTHFHLGNDSIQNYNFQMRDLTRNIGRIMWNLKQNTINLYMIT